MAFGLSVLSALLLDTIVMVVSQYMRTGSHYFTPKVSQWKVDIIYRLFYTGATTSESGWKWVGPCTRKPTRGRGVRLEYPSATKDGETIGVSTLIIFIILIIFKVKMSGYESP